MSKLDAYREIVLQNVPMASLTWLRLGGPIEYLAEPRSEAELIEILRASEEDELVARPLGDGSNILGSDVGAPGVAIRLSSEAFNKIEIDGARVTVGAGVKLGKLATATASEGLSGLEGLVGIPGTVGGCLVTNASTTSVSIGQWVESARLASYSGKIFDASRDELVFERRGSNLENLIVLSATFKLEKDDAVALTKRLQKTWIVRKKTRPELELGGLARMFRDPRGQRAAELIANANCVGARFGGATVCETSPNLVVTEENCSSEDVKRLLTLIETQVSNRFQVKLERELEIW